MRIVGGPAAAAVAAIALAGPAVRAQEIAGTGRQATPLFRLEAGLAVFEFEHRGRDRFLVVLLDDRAEVVARLADASGTFTGSKAVRVPRSGRYLLDVDADGAWTVRLRDAPAGVFRPGSTAGNGPPPDPERLAEARRAGESAAGGWPWGWFARGLAGGALAGPFGAGLVVHRAGGHDIAPPPAPVPGSLGPGYVESYRDAYTARLVSRRRSAAVAGGLVGTAAFLYALLQLIDVSGDGGGGSPPPGTDPQLSVSFSVHP